MEKNSFLELQKLHEERFSEKEEKIKKSIHGSVHSLKFIGNMLELYLPKFFGALLLWSGNNDQKRDTTIDYPNENLETHT